MLSGTVAEKYCNDNSLNFVSSGNVIYGDVNNNGTVDAADANESSQICVTDIGMLTDLRFLQFIKAP